uniref:Lens protein 2 n=1 Tax=Thermonectus marmoratus TaxID=183381 RepID=A0A291S1F8_THEMR|nr:lens protein 2 [Thermonectus marmoratus]
MKFLVVVSCLLAVACAKPGVLAPVAYSAVAPATFGYSAVPYAYSAPVAHTYSAVSPFAYSAPIVSPYVAPVVAGDHAVAVHDAHVKIADAHQNAFDQVKSRSRRAAVYVAPTAYTAPVAHPYAYSAPVAHPVAYSAPVVAHTSVVAPYVARSTAYDSVVNTPFAHTASYTYKHY